MIQKPYIYVYNADQAGPNNSPLTNGANYSNLIVDTQSDAPFLLRRAVGMSNVMTKWRLYNQKDSYLSSAPVATAKLADYAMMPELLYDPGAQIRFDAFNVALANHAYSTPDSVPNYYSQIAFQGVKLYGVSPYKTPYEYYDFQYNYPFDQTIDYAGRVGPDYIQPETYRIYSVQINNGDFQLLTISMSVKLDGEDEYIPCDSHFKILLLDQFQNQLASGPVLDSYVNRLNGNLNSIWPVPGVIYPVGGFIRFALVSLLTDDQLPAQLQIVFGGLWRRNA